MTFQVFTQLEQQEKFLPSVGVLCMNPREAVTTGFCKHYADRAGSVQTGCWGLFSTEAWGQVLRSVGAGCGWQGPGHIAQVPQLCIEVAHRMAVLQWEPFPAVNKSVTPPICVKQLSGAQQIPRRTLCGKR